MTCHCQTVLTAEDTESLIEPAWAHFDDEHPEFGLTIAHVRNYLESEDRSTGPTEHLDQIGDVEVRPITPESATDVVRFFDTDATPDNPAWGACYCMFYFRGGHANESWGNEPWQQNRSDQLERIVRGNTTGVLAYVAGKLAGWCNATSRAEFPSLATGGDEGVVSIVCFAIAPPYRRHGLATRLLEGVISTFSELGTQRLEAYPVRDPADERAAFHGSLDLFERAGFEIARNDPLVVGMDLR